MPTPFEHLVVLMMENRSFDHMLGYLKTKDYQIDGLNGDETNVAADGGSPIQVTPNARDENDLTPDPSHEFQDITWQIYRNSSGEDTGQGKMQGFVEDYAADCNNALHGPAVMHCFHENSLPILSFLAKNFAVSDKWFSSVPASTIPNRLFAHAACSGNSLTQDAIQAPATAKTIFQSMDEDESATYAIYASGPSILLANLYLMGKQDRFFPVEQFVDDCGNNALADYCFIEPLYDGVHANSQHPDFSVSKGESIIGQVYNTIRDSAAWNNTLLLIVYDEHGGLYDHVAPPVLKKTVEMPDLGPTKDFGFMFDRLGVRVPAVFVSPWLDAKTILPDRYDHCSIVKTVRELFCADKTPFTWREAQATSFANLPTRSKMRDEKPVLPDVVISDGKKALQPDRPLILPADARGDFPSQRGVITTEAAVGEPRTPVVPPIQKPQVRKPTDLVLQMAHAMEYALSLKHVKLSKTAHQIYTSEEAAEFHAEAKGTAADGGDR